tara:strand:- start:38 stop:271 length:234 start_codon:yes stop_codon:yes gene_type:complete
MIMEDFPLTPRQVQVLKFMKKYYRKHKYMPSYEEIMQHTGHKSRASMASLIDQLVQRGFIETKKAHPRAIKIIRDLI